MTDSRPPTPVPPPSGTVTFLFTDIEGSTELAQQYPDQLPTLLARHHAILREAITAHHGLVFKVIGDAFCAAFDTAPDAFQAALEAQRRLQHEAWSPAPIKVRMGLNIGSAQPELDGERVLDYSGYLTLTVVQRVMSTAYGGQVLISNAAAEMLRGQLPEAITLRDMGEHRLKGLQNLEHLWQLSAPDLTIDFPPLRTLSVIPNNLPVQLTTFIGRERESRETQEKLSAARLLTLIGPGGTGKTRLAVHIAEGQLDRFNDGAWFVELAPIVDPGLIVSTIATTFSLRETQGVPLVTIVLDYLRAKELLLVLDNCEHLVEASARVADQLLHACANLKIIASSREALGIDGETVYRVPSLSLPDHPASGGLDYEATQLFIDRAAKAEPRFKATKDNAAAIIQICQRLDGIPLAIELAAARVKLFTPEQIAERLDDRFKLLTGGSRTALPRQQTLRALIDWSYLSLNDIEQRSLRRLAVFAGGWTIEGAEFVIDDDEALDGLLGLVNKSLVNVAEQSGAARYRFLETIRQYAMDKLLESGEAIETRDRQLDYMLKFTGTPEPEIFLAGDPAWLDQMEMEHDNLRAALEWSASKHPAKAIQLAQALSNFWMIRDYNSEAVAWCKTILERSQAEPDLNPDRARLYAVLGQTAIFLGDLKLGQAAALSGLSLSDQAADPRAAARLNTVAGLASMYLGDLPAAQQYLQTVMGLARKMGYTAELAMALVLSAQATFFFGGDAALSKDYAAEAESLANEVSTQYGATISMFGFARLAGVLGDVDKARVKFKRAADEAQKIGNMRIVYSSHSELAHTLRKHGEIDEALELYREVLPKWKELGHRAAVAHELECIAFILSQKDQPDRALRLLGAAEALRQLIDSSMTPQEHAEYDSVLSKLQTQFDDNNFRQLREAGRSMSMDEAIQYALEAVTG